jgi:Icc-related predicted phosphoesterase
LTIKLQIVSDLHLEFADIEIKNAGADALALCGDICVAKYLATDGTKGNLFKDFFKRVADEFPVVFYVMGNHEHYDGHFESTAEKIEKILPGNVTLLDNEYIDFFGYGIVGGTLWTKFDDTFTEYQVNSGLNDFRLIRTGPEFRRFQVADTFKEHDKMLKLIKKTKPDIVLGHHAPSFNSVSPEYRDSRYSYLNPAYCTELTEFILDNPSIKLWAHGHVHSSHDYTIGDTRIFANPRGYRDENREFNSSRLVELSK